MQNYAQIVEGSVKNIAVFGGEPDAFFIAATGGEWVPVPEGLPVSIGHRWDGERFLTPEGDVVTMPEEGTLEA